MTTAPKMGRRALWILPLALVPGRTVRGHSVAQDDQPPDGDLGHRSGGDLRDDLPQLSLIPPPPHTRPTTDVATAVVSKFVAGLGMTVDGTVVSLAFGFLGVVLLQTIGTVVVHAIWRTVKR